MCCTAHACTFTLYPPGFAPYQRKPVLKLSPCGHRVFGEGDSLETDFESTMFEGAVLDTSNDRHRPRSKRRAARIVGVASDLAARLRERIAWALSLPGGPCIGCRDPPRMLGCRLAKSWRSSTCTGGIGTSTRRVTFLCPVAWPAIGVNRSSTTRMCMTFVAPLTPFRSLRTMRFTRVTFPVDHPHEIDSARQADQSNPRRGASGGPLGADLAQDGLLSVA